MLQKDFFLAFTRRNHSDYLPESISYSQTRESPTPIVHYQSLNVSLN
ncbi:MAG: hypothetical protein ACJA1H_002920 [Glaciecola sp.]|jgi:hypothetical protein